MISDAFLTDPLGWAGNQAAHALLIGCGGFALAAVTPLSRAQALGLILALFGVWEAATFAGDVLDAVTDFAFVAAGAVFGKAAWERDRGVTAYSFAAIVIAAAIGVGQRLP